MDSLTVHTWPVPGDVRLPLGRLLLLPLVPLPPPLLPLPPSLLLLPPPDLPNTLLGVNLVSACGAQPLPPPVLLGS